jgi:hypothetical protein
MKFRKKPVEIEAWPNEPDPPLAVQAPEWLTTACREGVVWGIGDHRLAIRTLEGTMIANRGDWIIRGVKGELYPCKPDIFDATYEVAQ